MNGKYEVDVPECRYQCDETYWNARRKMEESNTPLTLDVLRSEPWSKEHRTPVALPEQYRGKQHHLGGHSSLSTCWTSWPHMMFRWTREFLSPSNWRNSSRCG